MKIRRALGSWGLVSVVYFAALLWLDSRTGVLGQLPRLASVLPALVAATLVSLVLRFLRWHWLLRRAGYGVPLVSSALAYVAGFAFTATPGKVGELLRLRYLVPLGVPASRVIGAFVYERLFDLLAVLLIALPAAAEFQVFGVAASFVALVGAVVVVAALNPRLALRVAVVLRKLRLTRVSRIVRAVGGGMKDVRLWVTPLDVGVSLVAGLAAWGLAAGAFVVLLDSLGIPMGLVKAMALFPVAMLAGAASMLPGGLGSTEATIVALLTLGGAALGPASLAAVGIRLTTLWLATVLGMACFASLELLRAKRAVV